ncbi:hypothetical protein IW261DRAFT_1608778 [Armillaria novae-zelandiae]|uniref:Uncharacterized protein n=1 Tax=Armillaria novae-zelandiae TaxID=153914 RepID=A0AA39P5S2_9AGAR|nr:hypothetical protein IW261DRAFT_1608778 [Armillaria novae-zelandiae]
MLNASIPISTHLGGMLLWLEGFFVIWGLRSIGNISLGFNLFIGLLELLWRLDKTVAIPFTIIATFVVLFLLFTTLAPAMQYFYVVWRRSLAPLPPQCPYRSPQAWIIVSLFNQMFIWLTSIRPNIFERHSSFPRLDLQGPELAKPCSSWEKYDLYWVQDDADATASYMVGDSVEPYLGRCISWLTSHSDRPNLQTSVYNLFWNSIQSYNRRAQAGPDPSRNFIPGLFRWGYIRSTNSNRDIIASLVNEKRDELCFEAMEHSISKIVPDTLLGAYDEWSACSWDTPYKSLCNAHFTAASLLYLSGGSGLTGLKHCVQLIKEHLNHPTKSEYHFMLPPGVHAPFNAHIAAVTEGEEILNSSGQSMVVPVFDGSVLNCIIEPELDRDLYDCARLLLKKDHLYAPSEKFVIEEYIREVLPNTTDDFNNAQDGIKSVFLDALWMANRVPSYIPTMPRHTLPYLPQIVHFLLKKASLLQARSQYVSTLMMDMSKHLEELHSFGIPVVVKRDHICAFITLAIQEFHENRTPESPDGNHLGVYYPDIRPFIQRLQTSAAVLNVEENRSQWRDIVGRCGLEDSPFDSIPLEEVASIPLPPDEKLSDIIAQLTGHGIAVPSIFRLREEKGMYLDTDSISLTSNKSHSGSARGLYGGFLGVLRRRKGGNDIEMSG